MSAMCCCPLSANISSCQRRRDFCTDLCGFVRLQWSTLFQYGRKGNRLDELYDEPQLAVLLDRIEHGHCVRVLKSCRESSLTQRSLVGQFCFCC